MSLLEEYWTKRHEWPDSEPRYREWKESTEEQRQTKNKQILDFVRFRKRSTQNGTQKLREEYNQTKQIKGNKDQTRKQRNHPLEEHRYLTDQNRRRLDNRKTAIEILHIEIDLTQKKQVKEIKIQKNKKISKMQNQ